MIYSNIEMAQNEQTSSTLNHQGLLFNKSSTPLSSSSSSYNINKTRPQNIYQTQTNDAQIQRRLSSNMEHPNGSLLIQKQQQQEPPTMYSNYKLIKNLQPNNDQQINTNNSLLQPIMGSLDQMQLNEINLKECSNHAKLIKEIKTDSSSSASSILSQYDAADNSSTNSTNLQITNQKPNTLSQFNTDFKLINNLCSDYKLRSNLVNCNYGNVNGDMLLNYMNYEDSM
jgi:hypothetical protein